jgi:hypothetical protein
LLFRSWLACRRGYAKSEVVMDDLWQAWAYAMAWLAPLWAAVFVIGCVCGYIAGKRDA